MLVSNFSDKVMTAQLVCQEGGVFIFQGKMRTGHHQNVSVLYQAPEPADLRQSISGSALPFANPKMAFGAVNTGVVKSNSEGEFAFKVFTPNSYYLDDDIQNGVGQGKAFVKPHIKVHVTLGNGQVKKYNFDLGSHAIQLRSLTNYPSKYVRSTGRNTPSYCATPVFN